MKLIRFLYYKLININNCEYYFVYQTTNLKSMTLKRPIFPNQEIGCYTNIYIYYFDNIIKIYKKNILIFFKIVGYEF